MRNSDVHYYTPDQLHIWRSPTDRWLGDGIFKDLKAELFDIGWYYEQQHCEFAVEADDRCVYIKVLKADPDTDFTRTVGVKITWDNEKLYFLTPSLSWEEPHNDNHRIVSYATGQYFDEDGNDFKNEDGSYDIDAIVEKLWHYYKGQETTNYCSSNTEWRWLSVEEFRDRMCEVWGEVPRLLKEYVERKLNNDRG